MKNLLHTYHVKKKKSVYYLCPKVNKTDHNMMHEDENPKDICIKFIIVYVRNILYTSDNYDDENPEHMSRIYYY